MAGVARRRATIAHCLEVEQKVTGHSFKLFSISSPTERKCQDVNDNHVSGSLNIFYFIKNLHMVVTALLSQRGPLTWMLQMGPHT